MKKLIWLAILLPTFANAQWVNGVIQRNGSNGSVRYFQGANIDTLAKKSDLIPGLQDSLTKKANRTFDNIPDGGVPSEKLDLSATSPIFYNSATGVISSQAASASLAGYVDTLTQTFSGAKTFRSNEGLTVDNLAGSSVPTKLFHNGVQSLNINVKNESNSFAGAFSGTVTANRIYTIPNSSGTLALLSDLTNYVTTNTNQTTGLSGNKSWSGDHSWTKSITVSSSTGVAINGNVTGSGGVGVSGIADVSNGVGLYGRANFSNGTGVIGAGTSGYGVFGQATTSGYGGFFTTDTGEGIFASASSTGIIARFYNSTTAANIFTINPSSVVSTVPITGTRGIFSTSSTSPVTVNSTGAGVSIPFSVSGSEIGSIGSGAAIFPGNSNDYIGLRGATGKGLRLGSNGFVRMTMDVSGNTVWTGMATFGGRVSVTSSAADGARVWVNQAYNDGASSFGYDFYRTYDTGGANQLAGFIRVVRDDGDTNTGLSFAVANQGTSPTTQINLSPSGGVQFLAYGAGTLQTDASGNITASSDTTLKNIDSLFTKGLAEIKQVNPINYHWKPETGLDSLSSYTGFSAQNVGASIPEAVGIDPNGKLTLSDRTIMATAVNAIKELAARVEELESTVEAQAEQIQILQNKQ